MTSNDKYKFHTPIRVRFNETDLQGHVNFMWYAGFFDAAVTEYMDAIGYAYTEMEADKVNMYYVGTGTELKAPSYFAEVLNVHAKIGRIGNSSLSFHFAIYKAEDGILVSTGHINAVLVGMDTKRPIRVPDGLREAVTKYEGAPPPA